MNAPPRHEHGEIFEKIAECEWMENCGVAVQRSNSYIKRTGRPTELVLLAGEAFCMDGELRELQDNGVERNCYDH